MLRSRYAPFAILLLTIFSTIAAYFRGLFGGFELDDYTSIVDERGLHITRLDWSNLYHAAMSGDAGPLKRPIASISFAINYYFGHLNPLYFKETNLAIHLLTGLALWGLTRLLLRAYRERVPGGLSEGYERWLPVAISAAWLLHPLNLTGVLYIVQRMASLAAFFTVCAVITYVWGRLRINAGKKGGLAILLAGFLVLGLMATLTKENGALLPAFLAVIEVTFFRFETPGAGARRFLYGFYALFLLLPLCALAAFLLLRPEWLTAGYVGRSFTLQERLMTEPRVLWFYLRLMFAPDLSVMGIFHDDYVISKGLFNPPATFWAIAGLAGLLGVALASLKRAPILAFGLLWFFVGHAMESTFIPLELVFEHRNYLPMYGILFAAFYYLFHPRTLALLVRARIVLAIAFIMFLAGTTWVRAGQWASPLKLAQAEARHHPLSVRANYELGRQYFDEYVHNRRHEELRLAYRYLQRSVDVRSGDAEALVALIMLSYESGGSPQPAWISELKTRLLRAAPWASNTSALIALGDCQAKGYCKLPGAELTGILNAPLANPRVRGGLRADFAQIRDDYVPVAHAPDA
ncbi:MAG: hypothetical protein M0T84_16900 [Betaproteobacteria bacterium]|nr:hypothetical protein [Betaproteobacteria bacterium]